MPLITIESGSITKEQKSELIERMTQIASEITHIPGEYFFVSIKELPDENIGIGGKSIDKIKAGRQQSV
jgi:4-oxalocrotonate tautomerase